MVFWGEGEDSNKYVKQHMFKFASESTRPVSTPEHIYFDSDVEDGATRLVVLLSPSLSLSFSLSLSLSLSGLSRLSELPELSDRC